MNIIGFALTKISAEKISVFQTGYEVSTDITFTNIEKESIPLLNNLEALKVSFEYIITHAPKDKKSEALGKILMGGAIVLSANSEEIKKALKDWKKNNIPADFKIGLFNLILKKCTPKAISLEEDIDLPSHVPLPSLRADAVQNPEDKK